MKQAHDDPTSSILARENGFGALEACASCTAVSAMVTKSRETAAASLRTMHCISLLSIFLGATPRRQKDHHTTKLGRPLAVPVRVTLMKAQTGDVVEDNLHSIVQQ
jgi:hypothetical protein